MVLIPNVWWLIEYLDSCIIVFFLFMKLTTPCVGRLCLVIMSYMSEFVCSSSMFYINDNSGSENSLASRRMLNFRNNCIQEILRTCQSYNSFIKYLFGFEFCQSISYDVVEWK